MKHRIAIWAIVGFVVAGGWAVYAWVSTPPAMTFGDPLMSLVQLTCPIVFASFHFHFGVSLYWCLLANAAAYALAGLMAEGLRKRLHHAR